MKSAKLKKQEKIFTTAESLFEKRGYKGVSIDDIVKKAGIAKGTFYLYYSSKDELFGHILLSYKKYADEKIKCIECNDPDVKHRLKKAFLGRLKFISTKPILQEIFSENPDYFSPNVSLEKVFEMNETMTLQVLGNDKILREGVSSHFLAEVHWLFTSTIRFKAMHKHSEEVFWKHAELLAEVIIDGLFTESRWT